MQANTSTPTPINLLGERILDFRDVPKFIQKMRGHRPHISAVYRWAEGNGEGIALEYLQTPKGRITSAEAIQRFFQALTRQVPRQQPPLPRTSQAVDLIRKQRVAAKLGLKPAMNSVTPAVQPGQ